MRFEANRDYLSVRSRFAIEGLFPDAWIKAIHEEHATWFEEYSVDTADELEPYRIRDNHKSRVGQLLMEHADSQTDLQWATRWLSFGDAAERALTTSGPLLQ